MMDRSLLPPARSFYERELGELRPSSRGWARPVTGCPFHPSKSKQSFAVNLDTGGFNCFGCGMKGADVLAFLMLRDNIDFKSAARRLGAWRQKSLTKQERTEISAERWRRQEDARQELELQRRLRELRFEYRSKVHFYEGLVREARERINLRYISAEDRIACGCIISLGLDELREVVSAYYILSFALRAEQEQFVRDSSWRPHAIGGTLQRGFVCDDASHVAELELEA
ncbi:MAG: CHC2 zinc finger domain-containing protein [Acidobacteriota bacterium]